MSSPQDTDEATYAPVNVARPRWQCPHCRSDYYENLAAATECAEAGPPPAAPAGVPVLILHGDTVGRGGSPSFGLTEVGPVTRVRDEEGKPSHRRDVKVEGKTVNADLLGHAIRANDGLLIVTRTRRDRDVTERPGLGYGILAELMVGSARYGEFRDNGHRAWFAEPHRSGRPEPSWLLPPNEEQRAALNTVTGGLLDKVVAAEAEDMVSKALALYLPSSANSRSFSTPPAGLAGTTGGRHVALAHGAPNHIWGLRWLNEHLEQVVTWQVATAKRWAAGEGGPYPLGSWLRIPELPKNPGKRRLAAMEPFGWDYPQVRDVVLAQLDTEAPENPVPGLGNVEDTIRAPKEGN